jgi:hypothetical protein
MPSENLNRLKITEDAEKGYWLVSAEKPCPGRVRRVGRTPEKKVPNRTEKKGSLDNSFFLDSFYYNEAADGSWGP